MKSLGRSLLSISVAVLAGCHAQMASTSSRAPQTAEHLEFTVPASYDYLLALPEGYAEQKEQRWPLIVFLHGAGERGANLALLPRHGLPKLIAAGSKYPCIVVSPQCEEGTWWNLPAVEQFIREIARRYRVDPDRIYLTGLSMGGYATWGLALRHPERYAAIVPICGGGDPKQASRLKDLPIWAFHGAQDKLISPHESENMINAIQAAGGLPRFTLYPDAGHDAWSMTYTNDELYAWLLAQHRTR